MHHNDLIMGIEINAVKTIIAFLSKNIYCNILLIIYYCMIQDFMSCSKPFNMFVYGYTLTVVIVG